MSARDGRLTVLRAPEIGKAVRRLDPVTANEPVTPERNGFTNPGLDGFDPALNRAELSKVQVDDVELEQTPAPVISPEIIEAAERRGYEDGLAKAMEFVRKESDERHRRLDNLLASITQKRDDLLEVLEDDLVEFAFDAVVTIMGHAQLRETQIAEAVRLVLSKNREDASALVLRVAPEDLAFASSFAAHQVLDSQSKIKVLGDPDVRLGGCIIESTRGALDGRLETRLEKLKETLLEARCRNDALTEVESRDKEDISGQQVGFR